MTTFLAFVRKEALHILRDRRTLLVVVLLPIVQIILFGFAISTEVNDLRVRVATTGRLTDVGRLAARLDASHYLRIEPLNTPAGSNGKPADRNDRTADRGNGTADRKSVQGIGLNATDEAIDRTLRRGEADAAALLDGLGHGQGGAQGDTGGLPRGQARAQKHRAPQPLPRRGSPGPAQPPPARGLRLAQAQAARGGPRQGQGF